jgi:hypothetical protein
MCEFLISSMRATCPADFITLIIFGDKKRFEAHHCVIFSILLLLPLSSVQIFSSALCSQKLWIYVLTSGWETKFLTRTKNR